MSTSTEDAEQSQTSNRIYLIAVPFDEKDEAKAMGAKWHRPSRSWFVETPDHPARSRWPEPLPELLPGEDRTFGGNALFVDLVPASCWFTNARTCIDPKDWHRVQELVKRRAGFVCETCGAKGSLHVHERWEYEDATHTQRLRRLILLCKDCHAATHFGLANKRGKADEALARLAAVRRCSPDEARSHVNTAMDLWLKRSDVNWTLDLSILTAAGVEVIRPVDAGSRSDVASTVLGRATEAEATGSETDTAALAAAELDRLAATAEPEPPDETTKWLLGLVAELGQEPSPQPSSPPTANTPGKGDIHPKPDQAILSKARAMEADKTTRAADREAHRTHWQARWLEYIKDPRVREFDNLDAVRTARLTKARSAFTGAAEDRKVIRKGPGILPASKARYAAAVKRYAEFVEEWGEDIAPGPDAPPDEIEALAVAAGTALLVRDFNVLDARQTVIFKNLDSSRPGGLRGLIA